MSGPTQADPFAPMELFAFPLFSSVIAGHEEHREPLLQEILAYQKKYPGVRRSNRDGWHSGDEFLKSRNVHLGWMLQKVTTFARTALARYYDGWSRSELKMGSYWANVLGPGGFNAPHHHCPQHWSGVYYVRATPPANAAEDQGGMIEFVNPNPVQSTWGGGNFAYGPRDGLVLLFPSPLVHYVHPHHGEEDRVSIAFNFNVIPKSQLAAARRR